MDVQERIDTFYQFFEEFYKPELLESLRKGQKSLLVSFPKLSVFNPDLADDLLDNPDDVNVSISVSTKSVLIQIKSAKSDLGKIIGKKGRTIESLKIITLAIKNTHFPRDVRNISLEIIEDEKSSFLDLEQ